MLEREAQLPSQRVADAIPLTMEMIFEKLSTPQREQHDSDLRLGPFCKAFYQEVHRLMTDSAEPLDIKQIKGKPYNRPVFDAIMDNCVEKIS